MGLRSFIHRVTAPRPETNPPSGDLKMVFVVNHALKMGKGKIAAQVGHGAVKAFIDAGRKSPGHLQAWLSTGQKKICVKGTDAEHLTELEQQANDLDILASTVHDAGHTQIPSGSLTILALGPADATQLEPITGALKLL
jgi:PTH2 family peptidyl-tRNA hydrolase